MEEYQKYPIEIFWSEEDKEYIAVIPDLKGCSAGGLSYEEALKEIKIAMELWLESARESGWDIPTPRKRIYQGQTISQ